MQIGGLLRGGTLDRCHDPWIIILEEISAMSANPTLDDVWRLFQETDRILKEQARETDRLLKEQARETDRRFQETDRRFQETDRLFRATDKKLDKLDDLFNSQWGRLIESLVNGALVPLLNQRGIAVEQTTTRAKGCHEGQNWEFDLIAIDGQVVVIVEVKTTLRPKDVQKFLKKLSQAKQWMRQYAANTIYGAMAYLVADAGAEMMASHRGLFVIRATGDGASIVNDVDFNPRVW
jgi:hypothetical protein